MTLDEALLAPVKLRICAYLSGCEEADHRTVQEYCGLSVSNLSKQVSVLERLGYVLVTKVASGRYTKTRLRLTAAGRSALSAHLDALRALAQAATTESSRTDDAQSVHAG